MLNNPTVCSTLRVANIMRQALWNHPGTVPLDLAYRANELAGEVGEACNIAKKLERERRGLAGSRSTTGDLLEELADVVICVDLLAMAEGILTTEVPTDPGTLAGAGIWGADASARQVYDMTFFANRLAANAGSVCQAAWGAEVERRRSYGKPEPKPTPNRQLTSALIEVVAAVSALTNFMGVELYPAVVAKFNATSEKVGLAVLLSSAIPPIAETEPVPGPWQPIGTAPDGEAILVKGPSGYHKPHGEYVVLAHTDEEHRPPRLGGRRWLDASGDDITDKWPEPTHWARAP